MSRKEPRNAHATGEKVFWAPKTSLPLAGTFPDPFCRESAARHSKNGEVWYNTARMVKGR